ncbi:ATP-dependent endonuclease [Sphingorhabdus soli]|uniref:ATP-dependent endonuclease n=1 Tax=Flavisphingopyxis soli TaxID=2601267 RepID=A0A5C6UM07_9SPHN|nr:ATP-dependent endonuclease [Sphingorhabdus soli]TXC74037.1 ATP-dependent endonuclease [Sphingorhabdus soli]
MKLASISINNYRAISSLEISINDVTTLIGSNGVGKSCVLKGIDKFFAKSAAVSLEDFHDRNVSDPIEIGLTFNNLQEDELERYSTRVHGNSLRIVRVFHSNVGNRDNGRYFGFAYRHGAFEQIRQIDGANDQKSAFNALAASDAYPELEPQTRIADVSQAMADWEAAHPDQCNLARDDGQFEGFANVARGGLQKFVSFVFIPAVRDASADAADHKNAVLGQLLELYVKTVVQAKKAIKDFQEEVDERYKDLVSPEKIGELGELSVSLTKTLRSFYGESEVTLNWKEVDPLPLPMPTAETLLTEQGYTGPVEGKGHGLQRAFIFTILQHLAIALHASADEVSIESDLGDKEKQESHSIILAIEEPELYQHPTKQRHFAEVLRNLSSLDAHSSTQSVQLILCSHSPHFLSTDRFEEIRVIHRGSNEDGGSVSEVKQVTYQEVVDSLAEISDTPEKGLNVEALKVRLHTLTSIVAEGFFAKKVVLVEGVSDVAALRAAATVKNLSFEAEGIALLDVGGKTNLDKPLIIFSKLGVPTFVVFDSDGHKKNDHEKKINANIQIQKLCGVEDPQGIRTIVGSNFASFESCLENVLKEEVGQLEFDKAVGQAAHDFGLEASRVKKVPAAMTQVVKTCSIAGAKSVTLDAIVEAIFHGSF